MKKTALALMLIIALAGCKQNAGKTEITSTQTTSATVSPADTTIVNVYYFHGKQRCKTCIAVGDVARETVKKAYADNNQVIFTEINTTEESAKDLVEKYDVTWNALIIAKGKDFNEITKQAFATALENPQSLENLIKDEVNKRLQ